MNVKKINSTKEQNLLPVKRSNYIVNNQFFDLYIISLKFKSHNVICLWRYGYTLLEIDNNFSVSIYAEKWNELFLTRKNKLNLFSM